MTLLILLFFCHFLADYTHLSTWWMLEAKRFGEYPYLILTHAAVHAGLMVLVVMFFVSNPATVIILFLIQLGSHFLIDLWKGKMNFWFPVFQQPNNKLHWYLFGFDQFLHAVVIILIWRILQ